MVKLQQEEERRYLSLHIKKQEGFILLAWEGLEFVSAPS